MPTTIAFLFTNQHGLRLIVDGHPRNISTKLFRNWPDTFVEEDYLKFYNKVFIRQNSTIQRGLKESFRWYNQMNISAILFKNRQDTFGDFFEVFTIAI